MNEEKILSNLTEVQNEKEVYIKNSEVYVDKL